MAADDPKDETEVEGLYKTKVVQFFGRSVPIIIQNDNGPCPLIAICNVLLLRNNITISSDVSEVSVKKLLSLVAERLLDSNSNIQDKDAGYVQNQQQNIHDAIEMLPRLATGIDVNLHFSRVNDFEFTPERSIFDLLGIELYHGWIVDPQDTDTLNAIGSKSYNSLMAEIVSLEDIGNAEEEKKGFLEEESIDFAAATTATLGVPSPSLSRARSFDDSPISVVGNQILRKGDKNEENELLRVLQLSKADYLTSTNELSEDTLSRSPGARAPLDHLEGSIVNESQRPNVESRTFDNGGLFTETLSTETTISISTHAPGEEVSLLNCIARDCSTASEPTGNSTVTQDQSTPVLFVNSDNSSPSNPYENHSVTDQPIQPTGMEVGHTMLTESSTSNSNQNAIILPCAMADFPTSDVNSTLVDASKSGVDSSREVSEPMYEGEECILDPACLVFENSEPMYEGEMVLAEQADGVTGDASGVYTKDSAQKQRNTKLSMSAKEGELLQNFFKNNASQLTVYGLFCLQEGLKERELCVFFRNNHFSTMFKYNGELYVLATDVGYLNQPDLVWEKLNEVNGDTVFMTGNFTEFNAENQVNASWDEQNAVASTADYLASIDNSAAEDSTLNSDLQLAIALQQQEFDQQQQQQQQQQPPLLTHRQHPQTLQQSSGGGASRLVTGPQGPRSSNSSRTEGKSKEKCAVM